jgi:sugar phosphate isomerase/epimerase
MRLCFDATRFGYGLREAVELCVHKQLPAVEYAFEAFNVTGKSSATLSKDERSYLGGVREVCERNEITVECISLNSPLDIDDKTSAKRFGTMAAKLAAVANGVGAPRLGFYITAPVSDDWNEIAETHLAPLIDHCAKLDVKPVLRLSTAPPLQGKSLKKWRPIGPDDWRNLLSIAPGLSISFSPADCVWQSIDYLRSLPVFISAIEIVEAVNIEISRDLLADSGLFGPLWWRYRMAGRGQVDWRQFVEALKLYEYKGCISLRMDDEFLAATEFDTALEESAEHFKRLVRD